MRDRKDRATRRRSWVIRMLVVVVLTALGCEELGFEPEEVPPSRPRELRKPDWLTKEDLPQVPETEGDLGEVEATPLPDDELVEPEGAFALVLERYNTTERFSERSRAIEEVLPDMTIGDVNSAFEGIRSGKRLEAEVGMALLTGYYTEQQEWDKIESAYRDFFQKVPELRFDPRHILEHAWALYKLGKYEKALERADDAEQYFHNLTAGQSSLDFRARRLECKAWCSEGRFRQAISEGAEDDEAELWRNRAEQAWGEYRDLVKPYAEKSRRYAEMLALAEDHISGFQTRGN